ncbi:MAG TPA: DUF169 domain-containing protein, partial [Candidatus Binataceae bacterium]|nr:DUF169 domain-containing protein [Candidatus Binataceae bacterium]
ASNGLEWAIPIKETTMDDQLAGKIKKLDEALNLYVRPDTFPLAIRMLKPGEPLPEGVRVPSKSLNENWIVCQSIGVARRYGWSIAVGRDDVICPLSAIAFGFRKPNDQYLKGYAANGMYCDNEAAAVSLEANTWKFQPGSYDYVCVAPLARATFEPHLVAIYANSAQVMRLVNAALFKRGGRIESTTGGRLDCAEIVIQTMVSDAPKVILPCNGDRVFGMAQDTEMVFALPWNQVDDLLSGLEGTHKGGVRYPIPVAMRGTVTMPKKYQELLGMLSAAEKTGN